METLHISQVEENVYALNEVGKTVMYLIIGQQRALLLQHQAELDALRNAAR